MADVKKALRQLHKMLRVLPTSRRRMLYERLRAKIGEDIVAVMSEQGYTIEGLAKSLRLKNKELRNWIWGRDLKLSELVKLLAHLDSEFYPLIRPRNKWKGT